MYVTFEKIGDIPRQKLAERRETNPPPSVKARSGRAAIATPIKVVGCIGTGCVPLCPVIALRSANFYPLLQT